VGPPGLRRNSVNLFQCFQGFQHLLPMEEIVGLKTSHETVEKSGIHDGLEIDLVTHDAKKFFGLMLKKNGYVLEQLLSPLVVHTTPKHEELKGIATDCVTRHHAHHYRTT
jgi:hypothetical protein